VKTRVLSGIIMLPLLILVFLGDYFLLAACFFVGVLGVKEFFDGFSGLGIKPAYGVAYVSALLLYGMYISFPETEAMFILWLTVSVTASLLYLFKIEERRLEDAMATITGMLYVVFFSLHVAMTEQLEGYGLMVWLIILTAFGTDIMAYFTGYLFGKHKLCPKISPKKTIEGSVGGIFGSVILCAGFGYVFMPELILHCVVIGVLGGIISQFGDLTASIFKRKMGIKDYGNLIPGHGGILDRFDSVLFTAPMVYYYTVLLIIK